MIKKVFIIAGEPSGDLLGAKLMFEMRKQGNFQFYGIGGKAMTEQGLISIFPMEKISLMGFLEIVPKIFMLLKLINFTVLEIKKISPDIFVSIDSPGFCFRVAAKIQNLGFKLIHYVAPSVWAYKPQRARKVAKLYDYIISILPFEPPYFIQHGVFCKFIGHPITEDVKGNKELFMQKYNLAPHEDILCLMPGSRRGEINKLLPIFIEAAQLLREKFPHLHLVVIAFTPFVEEIRQAFAEKNLKVLVITQEDKLNAIAAAKVVLVKSGTSSLEVAYNHTPMVVAYRVNFFSSLLVKMMLRVPYVSIINIIAAKEIIPEFLQKKCKAKYLAPALEELLENQQLREKQISRFKKVIERLSLDQPSARAARIVLELMK